MSRSSEIVDSICNFLAESLNKTEGRGFVVGVSGGVDSAVVAALCCRAVGSERVRGIFMPSAVTPPHDSSDVISLADSLSLTVDTIPIHPFIDEYRRIPGFIETPYLLGNLMARTRMTLLYYTANRDQCLVCGTSNRTEFLLGYCTKYGDNAADIQPIIHLLKTDVWEVARFLSIPDSIITRAPSAGLWQGQTDEGELGHTYTDIDASIRHLDLQGWIPENEIEKKVESRCQSARHKQAPAYSFTNHR